MYMRLPSPSPSSSGRRPERIVESAGPVMLQHDQAFSYVVASRAKASTAGLVGRG
jgi:hypothetical protein